MIKISGYSDLQVKMDSLATAESKFFNKSGKLTIKDMIHLFQDNLTVKEPHFDSLVDGAVTVADFPNDSNIVVKGLRLKGSSTNSISVPLSGNVTKPSGGYGYNLAVAFRITAHTKYDYKVVPWAPSGVFLGGPGSYANNEGFIDSMEANNGYVTVKGWNCANADYGKKYHFIILWDSTKKIELARTTVYNIYHDGVANAYPGIYNANYSGFTATFPIEDNSYYTDELTIVSRYTNDPNGNDDNLDWWGDRTFVLGGNGPLSRTEDVPVSYYLKMCIPYHYNGGLRSYYYISSGKNNLASGDTKTVVCSMYVPYSDLYFSDDDSIEITISSDFGYETTFNIDGFSIYYAKDSSKTQWKDYHSIYKRKLLDSSYDGGFLMANTGSGNYNTNFSIIAKSEESVVPKGALCYLGFDLNINNGSFSMSNSELNLSMTVSFSDGTSTDFNIIDFSNEVKGNIDLGVCGYGDDNTVTGYFRSPTNASISYINFYLSNSNSDFNAATYNAYSISRIIECVSQSGAKLNDDTSTLASAYTNLANAFNAYFKTTTPYKIDDMIEALSSGTHTGGDSGDNNPPKPSVSSMVLIDKNKFHFTQSPGGNDETLHNGQTIQIGNNYLNHTFYNADAKTMLNSPKTRPTTILTLHLYVDTASGDNGKVNWGINGSGIYSTFIIDHEFKEFVSKVTIPTGLLVDANNDILIKSDNLLLIELSKSYIEISHK